MHPSPAALPRATRWFIVAVAVLQGLALYLTGRYAAALDGSGLPIALYALLLAVPTAMLLSVQGLRDARFWQQTVGLSLLVGALGAWAAWSATGAPQIETESVLAPFAVSLAIAWFIALPYLQCRIEHRRWCAPYQALFEHGWQNALTLALTGVFVAICWGVLGLCAVLFKLIGIGMFAELFVQPGFAWPVSGLMAGLGLLVGRTQQKPVQIARQVLFAIFKGLLPLLALVAVLFVLSLPFTGLEALWRTRAATLILMCVIALLVLFVNAVFQDGSGEPPYPRALRRVVDAALLSLPIYAGLGLYALGLRIVQYGWTGDRFWALLASVLLAAYACGYAWAALRPRRGWLHGIARVNVIVSLIALALAVAANSLLLDPHRLSVGDQLARLRDGRATVVDFDLKHLRFYSGRRGYQALLALRREPKFAAPAARDALAEAIATESPWYSPADRREQAPRTAANALRRIARAPGVDPVEPVWLQAVLERKLSAPDCLREDARCVLMAPDLDRDGVREYLLCEIEEYGSTCTLYALDGGRWGVAARSFIGTRERGTEALEAAMRAGKVEAVPPRWPELRFGDGKPFSLNEDTSPQRSEPVDPAALQRLRDAPRR